MTKHSAGDRKLLRQNLRDAKRQYPDLPKQQLSVLRDLTDTLHLSIFRSDLLYFSGKWYVSHSGLLRISASKAVCWNRYRDRTTHNRSFCESLGFQSYGSQIQIDELRRLRRCRSLQC